MKKLASAAVVVALLTAALVASIGLRGAGKPDARAAAFLAHVDEATGKNWSATAQGRQAWELFPGLVCDELNRGTLKYAVDALRKDGYSDETQQAIVGAAVGLYCPERVDTVAAYWPRNAESPRIR